MTLAASAAQERTAACRVAAIIPTWRKAAETLEAIESLRSGTLPPARTIVLDNGSGDGTLEALRKGTAGLHDVDVVGFGENLGFSRAVNAGLERSLANGATHLLLMNDDAVVEPDCLARLYTALDEDPSAGIAAPRILYHADPDRVWQGEGHYSPWRTGVVSPEKNRPRSECAAGNRPVTFATGCVLLIGRHVLEDVGLLEESLYFYEEDVEFERRAVRAGHAIMYVPGAVAYHKIESVSRDRTSPFVLYHLARSRVLRLRLAGGLELLYGLAVHLLAYTPYRLWQVWQGSRNRAAAGAWIRGTRDGLTHRFGHG